MKTELLFTAADNLLVPTLSEAVFSALTRFVCIAQVTKRGCVTAQQQNEHSSGTFQQISQGTHVSSAQNQPL